MVQTAQKQARIDLRISPDLKSTIEKAAILKGQTISSYILSNVVSSARQDIETMESIVLCNRDRDLFFDLLQNPPEPNEALKNLMNSDSHLIAE